MSSCLFIINNYILKFPRSVPNIIEYINTNVANDLVGERLKIFRRRRKRTSEAMKPQNPARQWHPDLLTLPGVGEGWKRWRLAQCFWRFISETRAHTNENASIQQKGRTFLGTDLALNNILHYPGRPWVPKLGRNMSKVVRESSLLLAAFLAASALCMQSIIS